MKYARAAWRIFLAWAARKAHLPQRMVLDLEDDASLAMFACSLDFECAEVVTEPPAPRIRGWKCRHLSLTAGGLVSVGPLTTGCGCDMQPIYAP
jgi:hypothetical protein